MHFKIQFGGGGWQKESGHCEKTENICSYLRRSWHCTGDRDQDHHHGKEIQKKQNGCLGCLTNSFEKKRGEQQMRKRKI